MQDIAKQHRVKWIIHQRKLRAVVASIIDRSFSAVSQIDSDRSAAKHCAQMMRDETVATANVQYFRPVRNDAGDLQRHVISAANLASSPLALPAAPDSFDDRFK